MAERPPEFVDLDIDDEDDDDIKPEEEPIPAADEENGDEDDFVDEEPSAERERVDEIDEVDELEDEEEEEPAGGELGPDEDDVIGRAAAVLKYIVEHIVDDPSQISIGATSDDRGPVLLLSVAEDDRGKVIGRQGRIVQAIRTVVKAATVGTGERVNVEIVD